MQGGKPQSATMLSAPAAACLQMSRVFQLKLLERLLSKQHISTTNTGNSMTSDSIMANGSFMTIVWQCWRTSGQASASCMLDMGITLP